MALSADDQLAIQKLYSQYNHAIDFGDAAGWAGCFTADGVFSSGSGQFAGTAALTEFAAGFAARMKARHWTNNLVVEGDGQNATGTCYLALYRLTPGEKPPATLLSTGVYTDTLVKSGGAWKFTKRHSVGDA